eukprot:1567459-Prymnesium_polylepis.4
MPLPFQSSSQGSGIVGDGVVGSVTSTESDFGLRSSRLDPGIPNSTIETRYALAQTAGGKTILNAFTGQPEPQIDFRVNDLTVGHIHLDGSTNFNTLNVSGDTTLGASSATTGLEIQRRTDMSTMLTAPTPQSGTVFVKKGATTPESEYALFVGDSADTVVNSPSILELRTANATRATLAASGLFVYGEMQSDSLKTTGSCELATSGAIVGYNGFMSSHVVGGSFRLYQKVNDSIDYNFSLSSWTQIKAPATDGRIQLQVSNGPTTHKTVLQVTGPNHSDSSLHNLVFIDGNLKATGECKLDTDATGFVKYNAFMKSYREYAGQNFNDGTPQNRWFLTRALNSTQTASPAVHFTMKVVSADPAGGSDVTLNGTSNVYLATGGTTALKVSRPIISTNPTVREGLVEVTGKLTNTGDCRLASDADKKVTMLNGGRLTIQPGSGTQASMLGNTSLLNMSSNNYALFISNGSTFLNTRVMSNGGTVGLRLGNSNALICTQPFGGTTTTTVTGALTNTGDASISTSGGRVDLGDSTDGLTFMSGTDAGVAGAGYVLMPRGSADYNTITQLQPTSFYELSRSYALHIPRANSSGQMNTNFNGRFICRFKIGGADRAVLDGNKLNVTGLVQSNGTTLTSDDRLKWNETPITNGLQTIRKLSPQTYDKA